MDATSDSIQSLGGKARAQSLTPEERSKIASKAGKASKIARRKRAREQKRSNNSGDKNPT